MSWLEQLLVEAVVCDENAHYEDETQTVFEIITYAALLGTQLPGEGSLEMELEGEICAVLEGSLHTWDSTS